MGSQGHRVNQDWTWAEAWADLGLRPPLDDLGLNLGSILDQPRAVFGTTFDQISTTGRVREAGGRNVGGNSSGTWAVTRTERGRNAPGNAGEKLAERGW